MRFLIHDLIGLGNQFTAAPRPDGSGWTISHQPIPVESLGPETAAA
jgi:hypothetical protein